MPGLAADCDASLIIDSQSHLTHLFVMTLRDFLIVSHVVESRVSVTVVGSDEMVVTCIVTCGAHIL